MEAVSRRDLLRSAGTAAFAHASHRVRLLDRHRNLFTGDSCVYFYNPELWQPDGLPYTAKAIHRSLESQCPSSLVSEQEARVN